MKVSYNDRGLVPAIAQDATTGRVLMLAWMNEEALQETLKTGQAHYFSRSRQSLWRKGETSGHTQQVVDVRLDCDGDAILLLIHQTGPACHTNELSCFFQVLSEDESGEGAVAPPPSGGIVHRLFRVLHQRKGASPESSYTASLFHKGMPAILAKVAEEAQETQDALRDESDERVVNETADLLYHVLVGLAARDIDVDAVAQVLAQRMGTSGLAEKAKRG